MKPKYFTPEVKNKLYPTYLFKPKYQRPIYKQIVSGICYGISFGFVLNIAVALIYAAVLFWGTPIGSFLNFIIFGGIIMPLFIVIFQWSLE